MFSRLHTYKSMLSQASALENKTPQVKQQTCFQNNTRLVIISLDRRPIAVELGRVLLISVFLWVKQTGFASLYNFGCHDLLPRTQRWNERNLSNSLAHWFLCSSKCLFPFSSLFEVSFSSVSEAAVHVCLLAILKVIFCQDHEIYGYTDTTHIQTLWALPAGLTYTMNIVLHFMLIWD